MLAAHRVLHAPVTSTFSPSVVQSGKGVPGSTGTSVTITLGSSPTPGNLQIAALNVSQYSGSRTATPPGSGWTVIDAGTVNENDMLQIWWREFQSGDGTSYTFSISGTAEWHSGVMYEIAGADMASPVNQYGSGTGSSTTTFTTASETPSVVPTLPLAFYAEDAGSNNGLAVTDGTAGWSIDQFAAPAYHSCAAASRATLTSDTSTAISNTFTITAGGAAMQIGSTLLIA